MVLGRGIEGEPVVTGHGHPGLEEGVPMSGRIVEGRAVRICSTCVLCQRRYHLNGAS